MEYVRRLGLARESYVLLMIYLFDLVTTFWLVSTGKAVEGNPIMSFYMQQGWVMLILAKAMLSLLPLFILEWCRRYRPRFVLSMLRFGICAYIGIYAVAFVNMNVLPPR